MAYPEVLAGLLRMQALSQTSAACRKVMFSSWATLQALVEVLSLLLDSDLPAESLNALYLVLASSLL